MVAAMRLLPVHLWDVLFEIPGAGFHLRSIAKAKALLIHKTWAGYREQLISASYIHQLAIGGAGQGILG